MLSTLNVLRRRYFCFQDRLWKTAVVFLCSQQGSNNYSCVVKRGCLSNKQTRMCIVLFKELLQNTLHKYQLASPCLRIMQSKMFVKMGFIKSMHLCIRWSVSWVCVASDWCHTAAPMSNTSAATLHRIGTWVEIVSRLKYYSDMLG